MSATHCDADAALVMRPSTAQQAKFLFTLRPANTIPRVASSHHSGTPSRQATPRAPVRGLVSGRRVHMFPSLSERRYKKPERVKGAKSSKDKPICKLGFERTKKLDNRSEARQIEQ